jgi:hypothetical protein
MIEAPKMLLKVIRTRGWVFKCVGLLLKSFRTLKIIFLAYGREQNVMKSNACRV